MSILRETASKPVEPFDGKIPDTLVKICAEGRLVLFAGAGFSSPLFPLWGTLMGTLLEQAGDEGIPVSDLAPLREQGRFYDLSEELEKRLGENRFYAFLRDQYAPRKLPAELPFRNAVIPRLRLRGILTTNYDKLLEMAYHYTGQFAAEKHLRSQGLTHTLWRGETFIMHLHGSIDEPPVVHGTRQLADLLGQEQQDTERWHFLASVFNTYPILFLGYSFNDPDLNELRVLLSKLTPYGPPQYALVPDSSVKHMKNQTPDLILIPYHHEAGAAHHHQVDAFLAALEREVNTFISAPEPEASATVSRSVSETKISMPLLSGGDIYLLQIGDRGIGLIGESERYPEKWAAISPLVDQGLISRTGGSNVQLYLTEAGWEHYWQLAAKFNYGSNHTMYVAHNLSADAVSYLKQLADNHGKPILVRGDTLFGKPFDELRKQGAELLAASYNFQGGGEFVRLNRFGAYVAGVAPTAEALRRWKRDGIIQQLSNEELETLARLMKEPTVVPIDASESELFNARHGVSFERLWGLQVLYRRREGPNKVAITLSDLGNEVVIWAGLKHRGA